MTATRSVPQAVPSDDRLAVGRRDRDGGSVLETRAARPQPHGTDRLEVAWRNRDAQPPEASSTRIATRSGPSIRHTTRTGSDVAWCSTRWPGGNVLPFSSRRT